MRYRRWIVAGVGAGILVSLVACGKKKEAHAGVDQGAVIQAPVETLALSASKETIEAIGTVASATTSVLASRMMGNIEAVTVKAGDAVVPGQLLVQISDSDVTAQLAKAKAGLVEAENALQEIEWGQRAAESAKKSAEAQRVLAEATHQRFRELLNRESVSRQEFEEVEARYKSAVSETDRAEQTLQSLGAKRNQVLARMDQARADVANAEVHLSDTRIVAPAQGLVTKKIAEVGDMATPGAPLIVVEDPGHYRIEVAVEESFVGRIHPGDAVSVSIDAIPDEILDGIVAEVVPTSEAASRSSLVKVELPNHSSLRSGLFGKASFIVGEGSWLSIPASAITSRGQLLSVYVVDKTDTAHLRLITTGRRIDDRIEVLSGLSPGERIVVGQIEKVQDGTRIKGANRSAAVE